MNKQTNKQTNRRMHTQTEGGCGREPRNKGLKKRWQVKKEGMKEGFSKLGKRETGK